jgi:pimeloyl-ACP methyl ester carboxylesterase
MDTVAVDGLSVRVHRGGAGPPVLYLHSGFGEAGRSPIVAALEERAAVLAPELPGFGASDPPVRWHRIEDAVFFLRRLLDECGWTAGVVAGSSLGAWLAAELAVWFPERVAGLVLFDPVGIRVEGEPVFDIFAHRQREVMARAFASAPDLTAVLGEAVAASDGSILFHFFKAMEATARIAWNPYFCDPHLEGRLGAIAVPVTVVWGERDGITSRPYAEAFAAAIPQARFEVFTDAAHLAALDQPQRAAALVAS